MEVSPSKAEVKNRKHPTTSSGTLQLLRSSTEPFQWSEGDYLNPMANFPLRYYILPTQAPSATQSGHMFFLAMKHRAGREIYTIH